MSAATAAGAGAAPIPESIDGDSIWLKALTVLPLIGLVVEIAVVSQLLLQFDQAAKNSLISKKIKVVTNQYFICGIIRGILTVAALVTLIALAVISPWFLIGAAVTVGSMALHSWLHQVTKK